MFLNKKEKYYDYEYEYENDKSATMTFLHYVVFAGCIIGFFWYMIYSGTA